MTEHNTFDLGARVRMPSLCDPAVANDALEAFLDTDDRLAGGVAFLICDEDGTLLQPILHSEQVTTYTTDQKWRAMLWAMGLCRMVADDQAGPLALLLALVRESGPICDEDRRWHQVAREACHEAGVRLIGTHVVTLERAAAMPTTIRAA